MAFFRGEDEALSKTPIPWSSIVSIKGLKPCGAVGISLPSAAAAAGITTAHLLIVLLDRVAALSSIGRGVLGAIFGLCAIRVGTVVVFQGHGVNDYRAVITGAQVGTWDGDTAVRVFQRDIHGDVVWWTRPSTVRNVVWTVEWFCLSHFSQHFAFQTKGMNCNAEV